MKKLLLTIFFVLYTVICFAEVEIYCPNCKEHIYTYQKDEFIVGDVVYAKDFKPAGLNKDNIPQPRERDPMICPICEIWFEGYDYSCWKNSLAIPIKYYRAYTFLTKDDDGNFVWQPYDLGYEE